MYAKKLITYQFTITVYARDTQAQHNQKHEINREKSCTGCSYGCYNVKPFQDKQIRDNQVFVITRAFR